MKLKFICTIRWVTSAKREQKYQEVFELSYHQGRILRKGGGGGIGPWSPLSGRQDSIISVE